MNRREDKVSKQMIARIFLWFSHRSRASSLSLKLSLREMMKQKVLILRKIKKFKGYFKKFRWYNKLNKFILSMPFDVELVLSSLCLSWECFLSARLMSVILIQLFWHMIWTISREVSFFVLRWFRDGRWWIDLFTS